MPDYYCVGPSMAADWGEDGPSLSRALMQRVFCYFVPYWRRALIVLGCIGISAGLGLAPALVTKGVIDYLGNPTNGVGPLALLVAGGVAASLAGGLIGVLRTFLQTSISQGIMFDLREQLFDRLLKPPRIWIQFPSSSSRRGCGRCSPAAPRSSSPIACRPSWPLMSFWFSTVATWSNGVRMLSWSDWAGSMHRSTNASFWLANASPEYRTSRPPAHR